MKKKRRIPVALYWIGGIVLLLAGLGFAGVGYFKEKKKEITEYGVKEMGIGETAFANDKVNYMGYLVFNTSLPKGITPENITIYTTFDGKFKKKSVLLKPTRSDAAIDTVYYKTSFGLTEFLNEVKRRQKTDSSLMESTIIIKGDVPLRDDDKPLVFHTSKKVKHFKYPEIKQGKLQLKKVGLHHIEMSLPVMVRNVGDYRLGIKNIYTKLKMGQDFDAEIREEPDIELGPGQKKDFNLPVKIDIHKPGKVISKVITNKDVYIADMYSKWNLEIHQKGNEGQAFPITINQKDTIELKPKKGEDRFDPGPEKPKKG